MTAHCDDYDTPWKEAVDHYFPEFMAFYFPEAHAQIDWDQPYRFLNQELAQVVQDAELGKRLLDRLVEVAMRGGGAAWVYIHIEVQGQFDAAFAERLFVYNYRLYDRYRRPVATLALLALLADEHHRFIRRHRLADETAGRTQPPALARPCHLGEEQKHALCDIRGTLRHRARIAAGIAAGGSARRNVCAGPPTQQALWPFAPADTGAFAAGSHRATGALGGAGFGCTDAGSGFQRSLTVTKRH
jgi:hypothetical protein